MRRCAGNTCFAKDLDILYLSGACEAAGFTSCTPLAGASTAQGGLQLSATVDLAHPDNGYFGYFDAQQHGWAFECAGDANEVGYGLCFVSALSDPYGRCCGPRQCSAVHLSLEWLPCT